MRFELAPRITAPFGSIDPFHATPHTGVDIALPIGSHIYVPDNGIVSKILDDDSNLGKAVFVKTKAGYQYIFGHLSEINVHVGERLHAGDLVALSGNTGNSTGPHLHLGMIDKAGQFVNPTHVEEVIEPERVGLLNKIIGNALHSAQENAQTHAREFVYDFVVGMAEGLRNVVIEMSYSVALIGGGLCIILHVAGWDKGKRWAGILTVAYALIKYLLG